MVTRNNSNTYLTIGANNEIIYPMQPMFLARLASTISNVTGNNTQYNIIYDTEILDVGGNFNISTGIFTASVTGKYCFKAITQTSGRSSADDYFLKIITSNRSYFLQTSNQTSGETGLFIAVLADMDIGDTAYCALQINGNGSDDMGVVGGDGTFFSGGLVC